MSRPIGIGYLTFVPGIRVPSLLKSRHKVLLVHADNLH